MKRTLENKAIILLFMGSILFAILFCILVYHSIAVPKKIKEADCEKQTEGYHYQIDQVEQKGNEYEIIGVAIKENEIIKKCKTKVGFWDKTTNDYFEVTTKLEKREELADKPNGVQNNYLLGGFSTRIKKQVFNKEHEYELIILYQNEGKKNILYTGIRLEG